MSDSTTDNGNSEGGYDYEAYERMRDAELERLKQWRSATFDLPYEERVERGAGIVRPFLEASGLTLGMEVEPAVQELIIDLLLYFRDKNQGFVRTQCVLAAALHTVATTAAARATLATSYKAPGYHVEAGALASMIVYRGGMTVDPECPSVIWHQADPATDPMKVLKGMAIGVQLYAGAELENLLPWPRSWEAAKAIIAILEAVEADLGPGGAFYQLLFVFEMWKADHTESPHQSQEPPGARPAYGVDRIAEVAADTQGIWLPASAVRQLTELAAACTRSDDGSRDDHATALIEAVRDIFPPAPEA